MQRVADAVRLAVPEASGALAADVDGPLGPVEVFVDASLSIKPFLAPGGLEVPFFTRLLEGLDNSLGDVTFHAFGFVAGADSQSVDRLSVGTLLRPDTYSRANNDFGTLFGSFAPDSTGDLGPVRIVISDGVESDPEGGARFGRVVGHVDEWVRSGGAFATMLFRAPYSGQYFSEGAACRGGGFAMTCPDRPLIAFVFAPTSQHIDRLLAELGSEMAPEHVVRVGGRDASLEPVESPASVGGRRVRPTLRDARMIPVPGFAPIATALVDEAEADENGFVPLTFRLTLGDNHAPWARLSASERDAFLNSLRPELLGWSVDARRDTVALTKFEPFVLDATVVADSAGAVVTIPVQRPRATGRHFAWLVSLVPYGSANTLVPGGFTTASDCDPATCGQTLNLAPLLGVILRDDYVPARLLMLTEWR